MISIWQSERETDIEICLLQPQMTPGQGQNSANRLSPANQTQLGSGEKYSFLTISYLSNCHAYLSRFYKDP